MIFQVECFLGCYYLLQGMIVISVKNQKDEYYQSSQYFYICKDYNVTNQYELKDWLFYLLNKVDNFNLFGRDVLIVKDLIDFTSEELNILYEYYPSLKDEVDKINLDYDEDYSNFLTKPNRNKINKNKHFF